MMDSSRGEIVRAEQRRMMKERLLSSPSLIVGIAIFAIIAAAALAVPIASSVDPDQTAARARFMPPSAEHIFGTDGLGRDLFARVMHGTRLSLLVGGAAALMSCALGTIIGIYASSFKMLDGVLMRICDGLAAIPAVLLAIALMEALGPSSVNVVIALVAVYTPGVARVVRVRALVTKSKGFVDAAIVQGAGSMRILRRHVLPHTVSPLTVQASFIFAQAVISEASLSFLGAGIPAPAASLGNLLQAARSEIYRAPWSVIFPGLAVMLCVLSLDLIGYGLRDATDPHRAVGR